MQGTTTFEGCQTDFYLRILEIVNVSLRNEANSKLQTERYSLRSIQIVDRYIVVGNNLDFRREL